MLRRIGFGAGFAAGSSDEKVFQVSREDFVHLSHECRISRAEIARQLGVCNSAIAKANEISDGVGSIC